MSELMLAEVESKDGETLLLPKLVTNCSTCGFAEVEDDVQVGCRLGMVERFRDRGVEIETVQPEQGGPASFRLLNVGCPRQRPHAWVDAREDKTIQEMLADIALESRQSFAVTIFVAPGRTLDDVKKTVASLEGSSEYLKYLSVVLDGAPESEQLRYFDYLMHDARVDGECVPFDVVNLEPNPERLEEAYDGRVQLRAIDEGVHRSEAIYYGASTAGYEWPRGHFAKINRVVVDDMDDVLCVGPEHKNEGFVVVKMFHELKEVGGNMTRVVHKKAKLFSEDIELPSAYKTWKEFAAL